uniref:Putative x-linked retinitis pigmentosa gtpase regulator n=1 Tax=Ixodes ricinus TaxID=34613 RepID=V5GJ75_IXORI
MFILSLLSCCLLFWLDYVSARVLKITVLQAKEASSNAGGTGHEALSGSGGEITADNEDPSVSDSAAGGKNQEDKEQNGEASGGDSHKEDQGIGTNTGSRTNGKKEAEGGGSKEKEGAGSGNGEGEGNSPGEEKEGRSLGSDLPTYIGTSEERKQYMVKLFNACGGQSQEHKINEKGIFFYNCTYTCVRKNTELNC